MILRANRRPAAFRLMILLLVGASLIGCGRKKTAEESGAPPPEAQAPGTPVASDHFPQASPAPDFTLEALDGSSVSLADFRGRVVLLDFWATWCPPCRAEIPHLIELFAEHSAEGLMVLGVAMDREGRSKVAPFVEEQGITYPIVLDAGQQAARAYGGVRNIPTAFLIDRDGLIRRRYVGYQAPEVFLRDLSVLLAAS